MPERPQPHQRRNYRHFLTIGTRWMDNDAYAHVNNVVYYSFFDTVVNEYLVRNAALDIQGGEVIGLVVETRCNFFSPITFPESICAGLRVGHIGSSSVRYDVGIFAGERDLASAQGQLLHVYVARAGRRPVPLPAPLRQALQRIAV